MDLWVRSQDRKRLLKVDLLSIKDFFNIVSDDFYVLGTYETSERALEILDEIQSLLQGNTNTTLEGKRQFIGVICANTRSIIYEMPKE